MSDRTLLALALAKTLYSEKRNYLDTFAPFILRGLEKGEYKSINEIETYLKESYSLDIPLNTIQSILKGLEREGFLALEGNRPNNLAAIAEDKANDYVDKANEQSEKIQRKQNKLIHALKDYLKENIGISFSKNEIADNLKKYVLKNVAGLALGNGKVDFDYDSQSPVNKSITRFLIEINDKDQELYEPFNDLLRGAVLWETISHKDNVDNESRIEKIEVFLDTNIVLSLLGLHHKSINRAVDQLNKLLQNDRNIYVRVFDKTIEEVIGLLAAYKHNKDNYGSQRVNHVYFFLKKQGYDNSDIDLLIGKLGEKLEENEVYSKKLGYEKPEDLPSREKELYESFYSRNREYETGKEEEYQKSENAIHKSSFHDVAVISKIRELRNGWQTSFESCKSVFVTNSYRLYSFSSSNKINNEAIPEVITDVALTNILWLKNPNKNLGVTIENLLHVHSSEFLIDNQIWRKFLNTLQKMHSDGEIDERDYGRLTSKNQLTDNYLLTKDQDDINPGSVQELNEKLEQEENKKNQQIAELKEKSKNKGDKIEDLLGEKSRIQNENNDLKENIKVLHENQKSLKKKFEEEALNKLVKQKLIDKKNSLRSKTWKGIGLTILVLIILYLLVSVMKLVPEVFPNGIWGLDVSQPTFENVFILVVSLVCIAIQVGYNSVSDSDWSIKQAYWSFFKPDKLFKKHRDSMRKELDKT